MIRKHTRYSLRKQTIALLIPAVLSALLARTSLGFDDLPHYLPENQPRYDAYIAENPDMPRDTAIAYVNAGVDKIFYSDVSTITEPGNTLVLCTKNSALSAGYVPEDLISVSGSHKLRADAAEQFLNMNDDAQLEGLNLIVYSAYRSYASQESVYSRYVRGNGNAADNYSARPGHSEHQTGLAVDILHKYGSSGFRSARFQNTDEYKWLTENAHKYGFILRYPEGLQDITGYIFEPWHWRYVGIQTATAMYYNGITTFEEYFGRYLAAASDKNTSLFIPAYYPVTVDGETFITESYTNGVVDLMKIRDIAYLLRDTALCFDIGWDEDTGTITTFTGTPYTAAGTELSYTKSTAVPSLSDITVKLSDGKNTGLTAYTLDGNCFIDLHKFAAVIGFTVSFEGKDYQSALNFA